MHGRGHSSSRGADVVVRSKAIAVVEGPGAGEETRCKVAPEVEAMEEGNGWVPKALLWTVDVELPVELLVWP